MKAVSFGPVPAMGTLEEKVEWCIRALRILENASNETDAARVANGFTVTNLTEDRSYDANASSTAELADVLGTLIKDLKNRGQKTRATTG